MEGSAYVEEGELLKGVAAENIVDAFRIEG
jgi:hypothetical protein